MIWKECLIWTEKPQSKVRFAPAPAIWDGFAEESWDMGDPLLLNNTFPLTVISILFKIAFVCFALRPPLSARHRIPFSRPYHSAPKAGLTLGGAGSEHQGTFSVPLLRGIEFEAAVVLWN